ncbi:ribose 5-phosphate isomerase B [Amphibacillus sediminis]|uniref:ribose 5-phosphate isomerase B n=1 Tax=Amphibacillus sediminis TaxID=360185 RepID=UPI000830A6C6|nr:ribose 5-phosphate isomerase B [Amphibacillus sediminis]
MKLGIGSDHNGFLFKRELKRLLTLTEHEVVDYGCKSCEPVHYPDIAFELAEDIKQGKLDRGILVCGTGIGMSIAANKIPQIRAALCHDVYSAEKAITSNNAHILSIGAQIVAPELGYKIVEAFLNAEWHGGHSELNIEKITNKERMLINH